MRRKIFIQCFSIVILGFLIVGISVHFFLNNYVASKVSEELSDTLDSVVAYVSEAEINGFQYSRIIDVYSLTSGSHIIVFDRQKNIQVCSSSATVALIEAGGKLPTMSTNEVLSGKSINRVDNFNDIFSSPVILIGKPVNHNNQVVGGVFALLPVPYLSEMKHEVFKPFVFVLFIALILTGIFSFVISKNIESPIREINNALKLIAKGDFEKRLNLNLGGELKHLSDDFNEIIAALQSQEKTRNSFIANVSHELRTPMTIITGFLQGILDGTIPPEKHAEYITLVISETNRLTRLVNDLLDVAKLESGSKDIVYDNFDINELLRIAIIKFENKIEEKGLDVRLTFEEDSCPVTANQDSITQVVTNLIDNAVKFVNPGGYISLATHIKGDTAYISVENSGEGISPQDIDRIWDKFHKTDKSRSMDKTGVGLGLYMVKSIIRTHNRNITVVSIPNEYTKFTFTLKTGKHHT